jgi:hypothetical protein
MYTSNIVEKYFICLLTILCNKDIFNYYFNIKNNMYFFLHKIKTNTLFNINMYIIIMLMIKKVVVFLIRESLYRALEKSTFVSKYEVQVKTYFLQKSKYGLRVQVSRFVDKKGDLNRKKDTVEIKLLIGGGGVVIDKTIKSITLERPTRKVNI